MQPRLNQVRSVRCGSHQRAGDGKRRTRLICLQTVGKVAESRCRHWFEDDRAAEAGAGGGYLAEDGQRQAAIGMSGPETGSQADQAVIESESAADISAIWRWSASASMAWGSTAEVIRGVRFHSC